MNGWRVTRYDPAKRTPGGGYLEHTWTAISDIGTTFDDGLLTREEYLRVEGLYLDAFRRFGRDAGVTGVIVEGLDHTTLDIREGDVLDMEAAFDVVRSMLREETSCRLESSSPPFYVHVGYDYYMHIGSERACERAVVETTAAGLFVEGPSCLSPWIPGSDD